MRELKYTYNGRNYSYVLKGTNEDINDSSPKLMVTKDGETKHLNLVRDGDPNADGNLRVTYNNVAYRIKKWPHILAMNYYHAGTDSWGGWWGGRSGERRYYGLSLTGNLFTGSNQNYNPYNRTLTATPSNISGTSGGAFIPSIHFAPGSGIGDANFYGVYGTHWIDGYPRETIIFSVKYTLDADNIVCQCTNLNGGYSAE